MSDKMTPWTSVDLYYKGVHVKKSIPDNIKIEELKKTIDAYLEAGFKPSWNEDTNRKADPETKAAVQKIIQKDMCPIHAVQMYKKEGKFGPYWSHGEQQDDGSWKNCYGKGWKLNKTLQNDKS